MPITNDTDRAIAQMQSLQSLLDNPHGPEAERQACGGQLHALVRRLSVENSRLRESQTFLRTVLAALVTEAGGELSLAERTLMLQEPSVELVTWTDKVARTLHIRTTKAKSPNAAGELPAPASKE